MKIKYIETPFGAFQFPESDTLISSACDKDHMFEEDCINLATDGLKECRTLVDVGAHVGTVGTQLMKRLNPLKTVCFELCPEFSSMLEHNMNVAKLGKHEIHNIALGDKSGTIGYNINERNTGDTRIIQGDSIAVRTLDSFNLTDIDFIKIDAQGTDFYVLKGALETIKRYKPFIWAEIDRTDEEQEIIFGTLRYSQEFLESLGYSVEIHGIQLFAKPMSRLGLANKMQRIPKIIHQTYETRELSPDLRRSVDALKKMNPEYTYIFYDKDDRVNFIKDNYPESVLTLFNKINPKYGAARADLFRYLVVYKMGGVYLDIKSTTSIPLREIIREDDSYLLSHWISKDWAEELGNPMGEYQQWHIIAEPSHVFLGQVLIKVYNNIASYSIDKDGTGKEATLKITGPLAYSTAILSVIKDNHPYRVKENEGQLGLQYYGNNVSSMQDKVDHYSKQTEPLII